MKNSFAAFIFALVLNGENEANGFRCGSGVRPSKFVPTKSAESILDSSSSLSSTRRSVSMSNQAFGSVARQQNSLLDELTRRELLNENNDYRRKSDFEPNLGKVIDTLRSDYPLFLDEPLDFSIYTNDVTLQDPSGVVLRGLKTYKRFFATLRFIKNTLVDGTDMRFRVNYDWLNQKVRVNWHLTVYFKGRLNRPTFIDCISVYDIDDEGFVKGHNVETIIVDGKGTLFDFNTMMGLWHHQELALASATRNHISKMRNTLEKSISTINAAKPLLASFKIDLPRTCESSWDCDSPMMCCDYVLVKMCCNEGMGIPVAEPRLVPIPIPVEDYPNQYPGNY